MTKAQKYDYLVKDLEELRMQLLHIAHDCDISSRGKLTKDSTQSDRELGQFLCGENVGYEEAFEMLNYIMDVRGLPGIKVE